MKRFLVKGVSIVALVAALAVPPAIGLSTGIAYADNNPHPSPGCTDIWNTAQSAMNSQAPGGDHSPGCDKKTDMP